MSSCPSSEWLVVTDFDGTLTRKDIGNELCKLFVPDQYRDLSQQYCSGQLTLREFQKTMWTGFPCSEKEFRNQSALMGDIRPGVNEFLEHCLQKEVPVIVASCGIDAYIDEVLKRHVSDWGQKAIVECCSNRARFDTNKLTSISPPNKDTSSPYPLHKGEFAQEKKESLQKKKVAVIGNGSSDRSFVGHADLIFATDSFADFCREKEQNFVYFDDFRQISQSAPF